jgi:hypothetical protein
VAAERRTPVVLEVGKTWTFATALDWPGWCRRGKGEAPAVAALLDYADRYAVVAGAGFRPGKPEVVERLTGTTTTDVGAPAVAGRCDDEPLDGKEAERLTALLEASWRYFDKVVAGAPERLRKGPRGGGRDRDAIVEHVREAERSYGRKIGVRMPPRTPWPEQRTELAAALRSGKSEGAWPARYALRRFAWHVLDHAWEIEDKSEVL